MASSSTPQPSHLRQTTHALANEMRVLERRGMTVAEEFKAFILRGNVVDLAVGVVIGAAFSGVVTAVVTDWITPLIAAIGAQPNFAGLNFTVNKSVFPYGHFLNALVSFVLIAAVVFFFVVKPINALVALRHREIEPPPEAATKDCPYCFNTIAEKATRCGFCTSELPAGAA